LLDGRGGKISKDGENRGGGWKDMSNDHDEGGSGDP